MKKFLLTILLLFMFFIISAQITIADDFIYGDLDNNGLVDTIDLVILHRYITGIIDEFSALYEAADLDGDSIITSMDAVLLERYIMGMIDVFPVEVEDEENLIVYPVTPNASSEAKALLNFHYSILGEKMLTGQMESGTIDWGPDSEMDYIFANTGVLPSIRGLDFVYKFDNHNVVQRAIEWWDDGGIPSIIWHWGVPTIGEGYETSLESFDIELALTPGTYENQYMMDDLERIADHLEAIMDANVPILWQPLHEVNGNKFWWSKGGSELAIELWQFIFEYLVYERDLNNLIWTYSFADYPEEEWFPGDEYVDIISVTSNLQGKLPANEMYFNALEIVDTDIPVIYRSNTMPDPEANFEEGMTWIGFKNWHSDYLYEQSIEHIKYVYHHDLTINLYDLPNIIDYIDEDDKEQYNIDIVIGGVLREEHSNLFTVTYDENTITFEEKDFTNGELSKSLYYLDGEVQFDLSVNNDILDEGYYILENESIIVNEEQSVIFKVEYREPYKVSGQVIDIYNEAIENAIVFFDGDKYIKTDEEGFWEKSGLTGSVIISVENEGYSFSPGSIVVNSPTNDLLFVGNELKDGYEGIVHHDNVISLTLADADNISELTFDRNRIIFKETSELVESLNIGNVILSEHSSPGAEYGLLKRITAISDDGKTIYVESATLEDVIKEGSISITEIISQDEIINNLRLSSGVELMGAMQENEENPFIKRLSDAVTIEGYLNIYADAVIALDLRYRRFINTPRSLEEFELKFQTGIETGKSLTVTDGETWEGETEIARIIGNPIPIYPPVFFQPEIILVAGATGEVSAELTASVSYGRGYEVGVRYNRNQGWERFENEIGDGFNLEKPTLTGEVSASIYAGPRLMGRVGLLCTLELGLGVDTFATVYANGEVEVFPEWKWLYNIDMYLESSIYANLQLFRLANLVEYEGPSNEFFRTSLAYGASGKVTDEEGKGLEGVEIRFDGGHSSVFTNSDGYWYKHLLNGTVEVEAIKEGHDIEPSSKTISNSSSDVDFVVKDNRFTIETIIVGNGSINIEPDLEDYIEGEEVILEAVAEEDWEFKRWGRDLSGSEKVITFVIEKDIDVLAIFIEDDLEKVEIRGQLGDYNDVVIAEGYVDNQGRRHGEWRFYDKPTTYVYSQSRLISSSEELDRRYRYTFGYRVLTRIYDTGRIISSYYEHISIPTPVVIYELERIRLFGGTIISGDRHWYIGGDLVWTYTAYVGPLPITQLFMEKFFPNYLSYVVEHYNLDRSE
ncbi:glycosyl hydrolase [Natronospora cellulosivora (SeqCode)]